MQSDSGGVQDYLFTRRTKTTPASLLPMLMYYAAICSFYFTLLWCVHLCVHVHMSMHMCIWVWKPDVDIWLSVPVVLYLIFASESLIKLEAYLLS